MYNGPIIDAHVHLFPDNLFEAIWRYFTKNYWNIKYRYHGDQVSKFLENQGVRYYSTLNYAHKPGLSSFINDWVNLFCKNHETAILFGTIHPFDPDVEKELERILSPSSLDFKGIKLQLLVTNFDPGIREMDVIYETLIKHDKILVMHSGTGPAKNEHVGIKKLFPVLERFPDLKLQIPHLGCFEYDDFFQLALDFKKVYLDTAMILVKHDLFPDKFKMNVMIDAFLSIQDKIMFGSDFPNIPYDYKKSLESIQDLPVNESVKKKIFWENACDFYNIDEKLNYNVNASDS
ncbi:MAG: amidohydrolase family protein [Promethearchaeota archaeon]